MTKQNSLLSAPEQTQNGLKDPRKRFTVGPRLGDYLQWTGYRQSSSQEGQTGPEVGPM